MIVRKIASSILTRNFNTTVTFHIKNKKFSTSKPPKILITGKFNLFHS